MSVLTRWIDHAWYPGFAGNWDDHIFRNRILALLKPESVVLDLGAGAGIVQQMNFRGHARKVCGIDVDPRVVANPLLDEGRVADAGLIPYDGGVFDLVFADNVLEHLETPEEVFKEVVRVLKPGGAFLLKTPNKWHYVPIIARLTPHSVHQFVNRLRGRADVDTFPTRYKANTKRVLHRLSRDAGLVVEHLDLIEGRPEYLRMTGVTYLLGTLYERVVNSREALASFRILLIGVLRKPR